MHMSGSSRRFGIGVASLVAAALAVTGCSGSKGGGGNAGSLRLVVTVTAATLPAWVAQDEGFFKKHDVEVNILTTQDLSSIVPALGRQYDLGVGIQPVTIKAASSGIDVVQVCGNEIATKAQPTIVVLAKPGSGINTPQDLIGKNLAAPTLSGNINYATKYWLKQQGVDVSKVNFRQVNTPLMPDQLKAGRIDAGELQEPYAEVLTNQGYKVVGNPLPAVGDPTYMSSWISTGSFAKAHTKEIDAFRHGLAEADKWIVANPDQARRILAKHTGQSLDLIKQSPLPKFTTDNPVQSLSQWDPVLKSVGDFTAKVDYNALVTNS